MRTAVQDATRDPAGLRAVVGCYPEFDELLPLATPWEHLRLAARLRGMRSWQDRAHERLSRFELAGAADRDPRALDGKSRRLSMVLAASHQPRLCSC